jgi:hypothetical protein
VLPATSAKRCDLVFRQALKIRKEDFWATMKTYALRSKEGMLPDFEQIIHHMKDDSRSGPHNQAEIQVVQAGVGIGPSYLVVAPCSSVIVMQDGPGRLEDGRHGAGVLVAAGRG